jgi:putative ABC transport system ATP-binding protein
MLDQSLTRYIWRHTRAQQLWIVAVVLASMIPYFLSFDLPKRIVNGPIQGEGFATEGATQTFGNITFALPLIGPVTLFPGVELERLGMLMALSGVFLALVIVNGLFKYYINTYKGRMGERLLRRIRFALVDQILRFPTAAFKRIKPAEISSMVKDEVEPLGGFAGEAFVSPAFLGGQALTAMVFIFVQSVPLGLIAAAIVGVQVFIIPRMRARLLVLGRERQLTARQLAGRVSEIVEGIGTVHTYDTSNWERADVAHRLGRIFKIRYDIYQWKFMVKFINNFLASVTPFLFYSIGGWLALRGQLDVGQLVAVIAAYKDLPGPLKELIDWDQARQDVQVKYQTVLAQFAVEGQLDPALQAPGAAGPVAAPLAAVNLGVIDEAGAQSLAAVSLALNRGETVGVVGGAAAGGDVLAEALVRLVAPDQGRVVAGETDLAGLPEAVTGRRITYVGPDPWFFFGTLRENLVYGLRHEALSAPPPGPEADWARAEARRSGNPEFTPEGEWIDYADAGLSGPEDLMRAILSALDTAGLSRDLLELALRTPLSSLGEEGAGAGALGAALVGMRGALREELGRQGLTDLVVPFEPGAYNREASVLENLLFGQARGPELAPEAIAGNAHFRATLAATGLDERLYAMGLNIARTLAELLGDLPPDHPLFQEQTLMGADDVPEFQQLLSRIDGKGAAPTPEERQRLQRLSFAYVEPRFRFGLLTADLMQAIIAFRAAFRDTMPEGLRPAFDPYDPDRAIAAASLLDNLLFGRISQKYRDGAERILSAVGALLEPHGLTERVLSVGLDYHVGAQGKRLTAVQRQKAGLARALLRRSDFYVLNRPLAALDSRTQEQVATATLAHLRALDPAPGVLWVLPNPRLATQFDRVAAFDKGRLAETGTAGELMEKNGIFRDLVSA